MGVLEHTSSGIRVTLRSHHLVGRSRACQLRLTAPDVSGTHASLTWADPCWMVRDLGSTNGTWVDGERMPSGEPVPLHAGQELSFGRSGGRWKLVSAAPPRPMARRLDTGDEVESEHLMLALGATEDGAGALIGLHDGEGWRMETADGVVDVADLDVVEVAGHRWQLHLPDEQADTVHLSADRVHFARVELVLRTSRHRETILLYLFDGQDHYFAGDYAHNLLLWALATRRLQDRAAGVSEAEQGWVYPEEACRMLKADPNALNVLIHRARKRLADIGVEGAVGLIQRRTSTRQLRLGTDRVRVEYP